MCQGHPQTINASPVSNILFLLLLKTPLCILPPCCPSLFPFHDHERHKIEWSSPLLLLNKRALHRTTIFPFSCLWGFVPRNALNSIRPSISDINMRGVFIGKLTAFVSCYRVKAKIWINAGIFEINVNKASFLFAVILLSHTVCYISEPVIWICWFNRRTFCSHNNDKLLFYPRAIQKIVIARFWHLLCSEMHFSKVTASIE